MVRATLQHAYRMFIRWAFVMFYTRFAWTYTTVAALVSHGLWWDWIESVGPLLRGRVLELGCGTGHLQAWATSRPQLRVYGLDASPFMLYQTSQRFGQVAPLRLVRAITQELPFIAQSFDTLVATFPSEYIAHPATLMECSRLLKPGGRIVIAYSAYITARLPADSLLEAIFRLSTQASPFEPPPDPISPLLRRGGFATEVHMIDVQGQSKVMVIVATKPA